FDSVRDMYTIPKIRPGSESPKEPETANTPEPASDGSPKGLAVVAKSRLRAKDSVFADATFRSLMITCAIALVTIVGLILYELISQSRFSIARFGFSFLTKSIWDPVAEDFGALPFIYGTVVSSLVALIIAVPLSLGTALFLTEICPRRIRAV